MHKLWRYYLSYAGALAAALILLFLQANLELALPDYLSRIVNVGIQQGGIESAVPEQIRPETFESVLRVSGMNISDFYTEAGDGTMKLTGEGRNTLAADSDMQEAFITGFLGALSEETGREDLNPESMDPGLKEQMTIRAVLYEYNAMGLNTGQIQSAYILRVGGQMLLLALAAAVATISVSLIASRVSAGVARTLRRDFFSRVESFSSSEFDRFSTASLITRNTNDITQIQMVTFMFIRMVMLAPIMGFGGVIRALGKAPSMAWIIAVSVVFLLGFIVLIMSIAMPRFKLMQKLVDNLNRVSREQLTGLLVVRAFNRQKFETGRFDQVNRELMENNLFVTRTMVVMMPAITLLMNVLSVIIIWVGSHRVAASLMPIGDMMAFMQYSVQIIMSFLMMSMMFMMIPRASVSAERIAEVLNCDPSITDPESPRRLPQRGEGILEFKEVDFRYPGADDAALTGVSFTAKPGETTAIIGSTGSGKSTLVNLIPRFYDVSGGGIFIDGTDIRELSQEDLRANIGYVPQKASLFSGTIASNLRYGNDDADDETLEDVCRTAQATEFIESRDEGLESPIAQSGSNISGGQKQRLSIARALTRPAKFLIFDDSFSALDFRTDAALRQALREKSKDTAKIIVAQRATTIMHAEQILVLEKGRLAGKGTHTELMENCDVYREIVLSQLSLKESQTNERN